MDVEFNYIYRGKQMKKVVPVKEIVSMIRDGKYHKCISEMQQDIAIFNHNGVKNSPLSAVKVPYVVWSRGESGYTGYVLLSLPVKDDKQLTELRRIINTYLHVVCTFKGSSGKSFKVVFAYDVPSEGDAKNNIELFHANAYSRAASFLQANTGIASTGKGNQTDGGCRISYDPEAYMNPNVVPIHIDMPTEMPDTTHAPTDNIESLAPEECLLPGYTQTEEDVTSFSIICRELNLETDDDVTLIISLAEECSRRDIDEEIAVKCALRMNRFSGKEMLVRSTFQMVYMSDKTKYKLAKPIPKSAIQLELMQRFLQSRYRFRQNELTGSVEYAELNNYVPRWQAYNDRVRNTICMEAIRAGVDVWDKDIDRYVNSTLVKTFDPISDWLNSLPKWDGKDRLSELASTVPSNWDRWNDMFRLWMRSVVCQWIRTRRLYGATMVLMLTGRQGTGKSTFFKRIIPPELSSYYVDRLDFTNKKEAERALIRFCLINLDEFDQISPRQTEFLKHILQKSDISYRKMYQSDIEQRRRYAAFCATTNSESPLTDPTGSRRYLVVEVTDMIDNSYKIDYQQLYAQVLNEICNGLPCYFDAETERIIQEHNANYTADMPLATMFNRTFAAASLKDIYIELTPTEVLLELKSIYKSGITINRSTATQLGKYLASRGIHTFTKDAKRYYRLRRL